MRVQWLHIARGASDTDETSPELIVSRSRTRAEHPVLGVVDLEPRLRLSFDVGRSHWVIWDIPSDDVFYSDWLPFPLSLPAYRSTYIAITRHAGAPRPPALMWLRSRTVPHTAPACLDEPLKQLLAALPELAELNIELAGGVESDDEAEDEEGEGEADGEEEEDGEDDGEDDAGDGDGDAGVEAGGADVDGDEIEDVDAEENDGDDDGGDDDDDADGGDDDGDDDDDDDDDDDEDDEDDDDDDVEEDDAGCC